MLCGCGCGCGGSSPSWSCYGYGELSVLGHAMGVGLCLGVRGSCRGVCVVGHRLCGHAVGVGCRGFYFCGCELIFLSSCGLMLVVVVVGCVK